MSDKETAKDKLNRITESRRSLIALALAPLAVFVLVLPMAGPWIGTTESTTATGLLDPLSIPKWVNQITGPPPVYVPTPVYDDSGRLVSYDYRVEMTELDQQILPPGFPKTHVWAYAGYAKDALTGQPLGYVANSPAPSFEAVRNVPINVEWVNNIRSPQMFAVDPTLHWANPNGMEMPMGDFPTFPPGFSEAQSPVPMIPHVHGAEDQSTSDGNPDAWFTWDGKQGPAYNTYRPTDPNAAVFHYPNAQPATTLWYHDHALGITRINVMSGLAGFYFLRDTSDPIAPLLPSGKYEVPLAIQDRTFNADGSLHFDTVGVNPDMHPYWMPEFFGDTIMVNGLVWPNMNVDQGQYRFRLLDGSNARFYSMNFSNRMPFTVIGTEGGYLRSAASMSKLTIAPGERYDILVDFSRIPAGTKITLLNTARTPFPSGDLPDGRTTSQIMQFTVVGKKGATPAVLPAILNPTLASGFPSLPATANKRTLVLTEVMGMDGPLEILLNGQKWSAPVSELPVLGSTEEWAIVNPTVDTHPIHLHLVQFQVVSRQKVDIERYYNDWVALNGEPPILDKATVELPVGPYLMGIAKAPLPQERGWKDTVQMQPGEVTIIRIKFAPIDGSGSYPFDATEGPGYVWHCHIIDHEDNEMMRPYFVVAPVTAVTRP